MRFWQSCKSKIKVWLSNVWILVTVKKMFSSKICFFHWADKDFDPNLALNFGKQFGTIWRNFFNRALASRGVIVVSWRQSTHEGTILKNDNIGNSCICLEYLILNSSLFELGSLLADLNWFFQKIRYYWFKKILLSFDIDGFVK